MSKLADDNVKLNIVGEFKAGTGVMELSLKHGIPHNTISDFLLSKTWQSWWEDYREKLESGEYSGFEGPKILTLDIETAPIKGHVWRLFKENIGLNQIDRDWYILSWAAKWMHEDGVMYEDKRDSWESEDDSELLKNIWTLLDETDIIITQNGKRFDQKKLNARFILNGMQPPSSYRHIDTCEEAKRTFGFTSNKLEYMTDKLCKKYKKLKHQSFPGFELWNECLRGNMAAWQEMEDYNINDVLSLEELYTIMRPWMQRHPNVNVYYNDNQTRCKCGSTDFVPDGYHYTNLSKFARFRCNDCGGELRDRVNLLPKDKRASLKTNVVA